MKTQPPIRFSGPGGALVRANYLSPALGLHCGSGGLGRSESNSRDLALSLIWRWSAVDSPMVPSR